MSLCGLGRSRDLKVDGRSGHSLFLPASSRLLNPCPRTPKVGEECAGPVKLGLAPKVLQNLWVLQNLSSTGFSLCETFYRTRLQNPKVPQNSGEPLGARIHLSRTGFFSSQKEVLSVRGGLTGYESLSHARGPSHLCQQLSCSACVRLAS